MYEPIGRCVKPTCKSVSRGERKDVKVALTGIVWWVALRRGFF
jgi:hypothetical protein